MQYPLHCSGDAKTAGVKSSLNWEHPKQERKFVSRQGKDAVRYHRPKREKYWETIISKIKHVYILNISS